MLKTHYLANGRIACNRVARSTGAARAVDNVFAVNCGLCRNNQDFKDAVEVALAAKQAAFEAQTPKPATHLLGHALICLMCDGTLFRYQGRSCMGHYDDYVCANCGTVNSTLTETGMCF